MIKRIFGVNCACYPVEFYEMLSPQRVDTFLLRIREYVKKRAVDLKLVKRKPNNVRILLAIPKLSGPKLGRADLLTNLDHAVYCLFLFLALPFLLLFYNTFIFLAPPYFNTTVIPFLRLFRKKVVLIVYDAWIEHSIQETRRVTFLTKIKWVFGRGLETLAIKGATKIFAITRFLVNLYTPHNSQVFHMPYGTDTKRIASIPPRRMFEEPTIVYLGSFETWRGVNLLIDAYRHVRDKVNTKLLLIGGGPAFDEIKKYADSDPNIKITGYMDHDKALSYVKGADVAVVPHKNCLSSWVISSAKCCEYMACEMPSVVTDSGEHAEWTREYETGVVVKDTPDDIARGILTLLEDEKFYGRIRENCRKNKWKMYFWETRKNYVKELTGVP